MNETISKCFIFACGALLSSQVWALSVDLSKEMPAAPKYSLDDSSTKDKISSLSGLAQMKFFELRRKTADCNRVASGLFDKTKNLRGWIALSWLRCNGVHPNTTNNAPLMKALDKISQSPELFDRGAWKQSLWTLWSDQSMDIVEGLMKLKNPAPAEKRIQSLLMFSDRLSKEDRAQLFRFMGDLAQLKKDYARALFYDQESMDLKESAAAGEKIRFLKKVLNIPFDDKDKKEAAEAKPILPEQQLEDRMNGSLKAGETLGALKDSVEILNSYPGSRVSRRLKDKPLDIYTSILDQADGDSGLTSKALEILNEADVVRMADWSSALHRRADYQGALNLSQKALITLSTSPQSTNLLWVAGRSAAFMGQYDLALKYFDELAMKHRGSDEASEAMFRMALIQYRLKNDAVAVVLFEKVLAEKKDRYELLGRYWMFRSLDRMKSERAASLRQEIVDRFPFSYYGIRLRAEINQNKVAWPEAIAPKSDVGSSIVWLEGEQVESWKRFTELAKNGWLSEAQTEMQDFPKPQNLHAEIILGEKLSQLGMSSLAIHWISDVLDQDAGLRNKDTMAFAFPERFKDLYIQEGSHNDLNARLLMSLTRQESAFNTRAVSSSNALGLMQMIPPTAKEVAQKLGIKKLELPEDMFRPEVNIAMGSFYVADMLKQFNNSVPFALAAYNAGPVRVNLWAQARTDLQTQMQTPSSRPEDEVWFDELPWTETSFYVKAILRNTLIYRLLDEGEFDLSPVVWSDLVNKKTPAQ